MNDSGKARFTDHVETTLEEVDMGRFVAKYFAAFFAYEFFVLEGLLPGGLVEVLGFLRVGLIVGGLEALLGIMREECGVTVEEVIVDEVDLHFEIGPEGEELANGEFLEGELVDHLAEGTLVLEGVALLHVGDDGVFFEEGVLEGAGADELSH